MQFSDLRVDGSGTVSQDSSHIEAQISFVNMDLRQDWRKSAVALWSRGGTLQLSTQLLTVEEFYVMESERRCTKDSSTEK